MINESNSSFRRLTIPSCTYTTTSTTTTAAAALPHNLFVPYPSLSILGKHLVFCPIPSMSCRAAIRFGAIVLIGGVMTCRDNPLVKL